MKPTETTTDAGKRIAAIANGQGFKEDTPAGHIPATQDERSEAILQPRHAAIGVNNDVQEHEGERLNPGSSGGGDSGAFGNKPKDPSNSA